VVEEKLNTLEAQLSFETQIQNVNSVNPPQERLSSLLECYQTGQYGDVEKLAVSITQEFPKHQFGWKMLGALFGQSGWNSEAVNANERAVALSPQDAEAHNNLGITLKVLSRLDEAEVSYAQAIALKPDYAEAHSN
jgi:Flp pilus assembly protein TadD